MADFQLLLDGILFDGFEIPESIKGGGAQALAVHKYPGGARTVDAMGPDDADISWTGRFLDYDAQSRCQQIDIMRRQGQVVPLTYDAYSYDVIVKEFTWSFERFYQISYSITLLVVQDQTGLIPDGSFDIDSAFRDALDFVGIDADFLGDFSFNSLLSDIQYAVGAVSSTVSTVTSVAGAAANSISAVGSIVNGGAPFLTSLSGKVFQAQSYVSGLQGAADTAMGTVGLASRFASGLSPQTMISNIGGLRTTAQQLPAAFDANARLGNMSIDLASIQWDNSAQTGPIRMPIGLNGG